MTEYRIVKLGDQETYKIQRWRKASFWRGECWVDLKELVGFYEPYREVQEFRTREAACRHLTEVKKIDHIRNLRDCNEWNPVHCDQPLANNVAELLAKLESLATHWTRLGKGDKHFGYGFEEAGRTLQEVVDKWVE